MLAHNLNRDVRAARLFEQGQVFLGTADGEGIGEVVETASLALGLTSATTRTDVALQCGGCADL